jgi:cell division septation protein DedD
MMRDSDRLKDKLEVSLDNRQIFYLLFGSALVACLVFVIGVLVGKKLENRKFAHKPPGAADELARIDHETKLAAKGLTFHDELIKPDSRSARNEPPEVAEWRDMGQGKVGAASAAHRANVVAVAGRAPSKGSARAVAKPAKKKRYTLQVSAFKSKVEADQVMKKLQKNGYRPYVVASKLPRRGVWYRVRLGTYQSWGQAVSAKEKFEEKLDMTAYVSRR